MSYFLIAVSNRHNLDLCIRHALAGFTSSASGLWTYLDIRPGDFVSLLYGARVFNLYRVARKAAYRNAENLPPWPPITFQPSRRTYYFPFRLELTCLRTLEEQLVRSEFAYVAENLLLRGGYRKTHFQADQTTLQAVSEMGRMSPQNSEALSMNSAETFIPQLTTDKSKARPPQVFVFRELFLQAVVRSYLTSGERLSHLLTQTGLSGSDAGGLEVLSEKAFPEGHVDLLVKEAAPKGLSRKVVIEVKRGGATAAHMEQLAKYKNTLGEECVGAVLLAKESSVKARENARRRGIVLLHYALDFPADPASFEALVTHFKIYEPHDR